MPNSNLVNSKTNMKTRIRSQVSGSNPRDLGRLAKSAKFVGLTDDAEVETDIDTEMAAAIPSASIDDLVEMSEGLKELRSTSGDLGSVANADNLTEGGNKFLKAENVQPALSVSGDLSYDSGVVSYTAPTSSALQVVATVGDLPAGASAGDQAVVQSNNKLYIKTADGWYAVALINTAPTVSGNDAAYTLATDQTPTVITLTATDPENDPVSFSHAVTSGALNGTTVTQNDNVFTITPHGLLPATFELTFSADDSVNVATSVSSFTLAFALSFDYTNSTPTTITLPDPKAYDSFGFPIVAARAGNTIVASRNDGENWETRNCKILGYDVSDPTNPQLLWTVPTTGNSILSAVTLKNSSDTHFTEVVSSSYYGSTNVIYVRKFSDGLVEYALNLGTYPGHGSKQPDNLCFSEDGQRIYVGYANTMNNVGPSLGIAVEEYELSTGNLLGTFDYPGGYTSRPSNGHHLNYGTIAVGDGWVAIGALNDGGTDQSGPASKNEQVGRVYVFDSTTRNHIASIDSPVISTNSMGPNHHKFGGGSWDVANHYASDDGKYLITTNTINQGGWVNGVWTVNPGAFIHIYDLTDPTSPSLVASIGNPAAADRSIIEIATRGDYIYFAYEVNNSGGKASSVMTISTQQIEYTEQDIGNSPSLAITENGTFAIGSGSSERIRLYPANT